MRFGLVVFVCGLFISCIGRNQRTVDEVRGLEKGSPTSITMVCTPERDSREGVEAVERYQKIRMTHGFVFTHAGHKHPLACLALQLPSPEAIARALSAFPVLADVYVAPVDFRWTSVVTHENSSGTGPFFAECGGDKK